MSDVSPPALLGLEQVEDRLTEPEPLCLVLLAVEPRSAGEGTPWQPATALVEAITGRLRAAMRPYDELRLLADGRFVLILPTLASTDDLRRSVTRLFEAVDAPYPMAGTELRTRTLLGAGVRTPGESPAEFLGRIVAAVDAARDSDGHHPVLV
ncbi:MAG: hypothetical protein AAFO29_05580 [Actinomycetota bacterium]